MSLFEGTKLACPSCGQEIAFEAVLSVNVDRRPELRDAIMQGRFQRESCGKCGTEFRLDPKFTYIDVGRSDWIAVYPLDDLELWREMEQQVREVFDTAFGAQAPAAARDLGAGMKPRLVFGWPALWEKLAVKNSGLDDVQLELTKVGLLKGLPDSPLGDATELRFVGVSREDPDELVLAWFESATADIVQALNVPRELYDQVATDGEAWAELRSELEPGLFVDMKRLITVGA